jgi:hypothetical protein
MRPSLNIGASGALIALTTATINPLEAIAVDEDIIFRGDHEGERAIWKRDVDGDIVRLAEGFGDGNMFEIFDDAIFADAVSTLDSPDGEAHAAAFRILLDGEITRMAELRTTVVKLTGLGEEFTEIDAKFLTADVVGDRLLISNLAEGSGGFTTFTFTAASSLSKSGDLERIGQGAPLITPNRTVLYVVPSNRHYIVATYDQEIAEIGNFTTLKHHRLVGFIDDTAVLKIANTPIVRTFDFENGLQDTLGVNGSAFNLLGVRQITVAEKFGEDLLFKAQTAETGR